MHLPRQLAVAREELGIVVDVLRQRRYSPFSLPPRLARFIGKADREHAISSPRKALVLDAVWLVGTDPEPALTVGFVVLEIAFEPFDMRLTFKGEHVGGDAIEEPAVMADDHGTTGKIFERRFQRPQRFDVQIIGWFVKQEQIGA